MCCTLESEMHAALRKLAAQLARFLGVHSPIPHVTVPADQADDHLPVP